MENVCFVDLSHSVQTNILCMLGVSMKHGASYMSYINTYTNSTAGSVVTTVLNMRRTLII